jgi:hypothetical protein
MSGFLSAPCSASARASQTAPLTSCRTSAYFFGCASHKRNSTFMSSRSMQQLATSWCHFGNEVYTQNEAEITPSAKCLPRDAVREDWEKKEGPNCENKTLARVRKKKIAVIL